jgi:hypothetical protein
MIIMKTQPYTLWQAFGAHQFLSNNIELEI